MWPVSKSEAVRFAAESDRADIRRIWQSCFGDPPEDVDRFSDGCPHRTVLAEDGGRPAAMLHLIPCRMGERRGYYVYAVGTLPEARGKGLMRRAEDFACRHAAAEGRDFLILVPAEPSLFDLYAKLDYRPFSAVETLAIPRLPEPERPEALSPADFETFAKRRSTHARRFDAFVRFEERAERYAFEEFRRDGGQILFSENRYFCIKSQGDRIVIVETDAEPEEAARILGGIEPSRPLFLRRPGPQPFSMMKPLSTDLPATPADRRWFAFPMD